MLLWPPPPFEGEKQRNIQPQNLGICLKTMGLQMLAAVLTGLLELYKPELLLLWCLESFWYQEIREEGIQALVVQVLVHVFIPTWETHTDLILLTSYAKRVCGRKKNLEGRQIFSFNVLTQSWTWARLAKTAITLNSSKESGIVVYNTIYCISEARRFRIWGYN